ncbi:hypothetical protein P167DRAFT_571208 [Morchella conica CCBAS932]|uniref:Uncharacterized protein n=1 Tax=Morchella conica CCBAS932 TaxID=1392247 RepID=A0A3N4LC30_9PEZI|nr:hypothetical protein P167DRAFT_571208 [Morchella conica CCBAS932]
MPSPTRRTAQRHTPAAGSKDGKAGGRQAGTTLHLPPGRGRRSGTHRGERGARRMAGVGGSGLSRSVGDLWDRAQRPGRRDHTFLLMEEGTGGTHTCRQEGGEGDHRSSPPLPNCIPERW